MKLWFENFWDGFKKTEFFITKILKKYIDVEFDSQDPDLVIYSIFGNKENVYKYNSKTKLCFHNIEIYYTIFDKIKFIDIDDYQFDFSITQYPNDNKNIYCPFWLYRLGFENPNDSLYYLNLTEKRIPSIKTKYCNFIYSNPAEYTSPRNEFFEYLSKFKKVESLGKFKNNQKFKKPLHSDKKINTIKNFLYTISFENSYEYYNNTEKILEPLLGSSVPIYWGGEYGFKYFNRDLYVFANNKSNQEILNEMNELEKNKDKIKYMTTEPIFNYFPKECTPKFIVEKLLSYL